jgi:DNA-binding transcriptional LysR family regulator
MLDVRRLHVLVAVVDAGSITAAANLLGFTPSAVSQNIAALERATGTVLLEKAGRGVRPTQAGLLLAAHAEAVIARLREAEAALAALRAGQAGRLRLATFATAGATLVPRALARFRAVHGAVELDLTVADTEEAVTGLRAGRLDLAVIALDAAPAEVDEDLVWTHVLGDPFRAVLPRTHPLASRRTIALADLADDSWIVTASEHCYSREVVTSACGGAGFAPRFAIETDEFTTAVGFVNAGLGVALVPLLALGSLPHDVRVRPLRGCEPVRHIYGVTRHASAEEVTVRAMLEALTESARSYVSTAA